MDIIFKKFLFSKNILVGDRNKKNSDEETFAFLHAMASLFSIKIEKGAELLDEDQIKFVSSMLGEDVPDAFYLGFPKSVKKLSKSKRSYDRAFHYFITYGLGDFSEPGHSVFEEDFERSAFKEETTPKLFSVLDENDAVQVLTSYIEAMLKSTRPLNIDQYYILLSFIDEYNYTITSCSCRDTVIRLILDTRRIEYADFISLFDVIKLVEKINYYEYGNTNIKNLSLKNKDRKFIAAILDRLFERGDDQLNYCMEKRAVWCGLLHHLHYKGKNDFAKHFIEEIRSGKNCSYASQFEKNIADGEIIKAVDLLVSKKGQNALLRNLNYVLSRCKTDDEINYVINKISDGNNITLMQLLLQYHSYSSRVRTFKFVRFNKLVTHMETWQEIIKRKSVILEDVRKCTIEKIRCILSSNLAGRVGKTYISEKMYNIAVPVQESDSMGGYGVLPKGSRIHIEDGEKIRAFTYWEKVNDIDLSCIAISENGKQREYSWRTMDVYNSPEITFSGDQTSGYNGGSEFFDVNIDLFKKKNPDFRYLVFCDNVYSPLCFNQCLCKAGYMIRSKRDSGKIFEPKTVKSSFTVNADSTMCFLFAIDLETRDFIWLNSALDSLDAIAGENAVSFATSYLKRTEVINLGTLFEMMACEIVTDSTQADVVLSDEEEKIGDGACVIHSYDFEKILSLLS